MGNKPKRRGVSRNAKVTILSLPIDQRTRKMNQAAMAQERRESHAAYLGQLKGLSSSSKQALNRISGTDESPELSDNEDVEIFVPNTEQPDDQAEWEDVEDESSAFVTALREMLSIRSTGRTYKDHRSWRQRRERAEREWSNILDDLCDAYLSWKEGKVPAPPESLGDIDSEMEDVTSVPEIISFDIQIFDMYTLRTTATIQRASDSRSQAIDLVTAGYFPASPVQPSLAFSLKTLEFYHTIRLFRASFSIEAFTKVLCHLYRIPYRRYYRTAFSDAFDNFLAMERITRRRVREALGYNQPNYRVLNSCPACCYKLKNEPPLDFSRMWVMDGNNSLKRIKGIAQRKVADLRVFAESDYYLSEDYVNQFAKEISAPSAETQDATESDDEDIDDGDPTDGIMQAVQSQCRENWKAANADAKKKMWAIFQEAGIFASACPHGFILWIADMIASGELAKYGLAMVDMALKLFPPDWLSGYDIGCTFQGTVENSSLGDAFREAKARFCVNAFHGYSHNFLCQLVFHPNIIRGMGLEDLETLERIFSQSNILASTTRYMSAYRRRVFIDMFFRQWDEEKYQNLGNWLYNNYKQALQIIQDYALDVELTLKSLNLTPENLDAFQQDQVKYFQSLGRESSEDLHAIAYVEMLEKRRILRLELDRVNHTFRTQTAADYQFVAPNQSYSSNLSETRKTETQRRRLHEQCDELTDEIIQLEVAMDIGRRWEPSDKNYQETLSYLSQREYEQALDHLQKLVTLRLFELQKLNLSQTGYRMRTHLAKSLQRRSKAIRSAVAKVNTAATKLRPPKPTLDWEKVSHYSFLDDFEILRDTRQSINDQTWASPVVQDLMKQYQKLKRAQESIVRCNVEVRRLHTSIIDEQRHFTAVLAGLELGNSPLLGAVKDFVLRRKAQQSLILARIMQIYNLDGFTGTPSPGTREGTESTMIPATTDSPAFNTELSDGDGEDSEDEDSPAEFEGIINYLAQLSLD